MDISKSVMQELLSSGFAARGELLPGERIQTVRADTAAVTCPVFLPDADFPAAQRAKQSGVGAAQKGPSLKMKKIKKTVDKIENPC